MANILLNDLGAAIKPYQAALGGPDTPFLKLGLSPDDIAPSLSRDHSLIWIDTEGYEGIILTGAHAAIANRVPLVVEFTPQFMRMLN